MIESTGDPPQVRLAIREDVDVVVARCRVRELARAVQMRDTAVEALATAVSEVVRNIVVHARAGEVRLSMVRDGPRCGIMVVARDDGPGISNIELAMQDGYTTRNSLGLGLSSAQRLVDEFELVSRTGADAGTTVTLMQWLP